MVGTVSTVAGLKWNDSIDITDSDFIANTIGAAIEYPSSVNSPFDNNALTFSGNTNDANNTSGSAITVNKLAGSNPATYTGSLVTFSASFTLTLTDIPQDVQVTLVNSSTRAELQNSTTPVSGIVTYSHSGGEIVDILFMDIDFDPNLSDIFDLTLSNADQSIKIGLIDDPNYDNP